MNTLLISPYGTRVVQSIIEVIESHDLLLSFINVVQPYLLEAIKDINGNHSIQKLITVVDNIYFDFLYKCIDDNLEDIINNKFGCCVVQQLICYSNINQKVYNH